MLKNGAQKLARGMYPNTSAAQPFCPSPLANLRLYGRSQTKALGMGRFPRMKTLWITFHSTFGWLGGFGGSLAWVESMACAGVRSRRRFYFQPGRGAPQELQAEGDMRHFLFASRLIVSSIQASCRNSPSRRVQKILRGPLFKRSFKSS